MAGRLAITRWAAALSVVKAVHAFLREAIAERETLRQQQRQSFSEKREIAMKKRERNRANGSNPGTVLEEINREPWYPEDGEAQNTMQTMAAINQRKTTPLRTAIANRICGWTWHTPDSTAEQPGISWIELQTALLLDDEIIDLDKGHEQ